MAIQLYDPHADKADLLAKLAGLEPYRLGLCATEEELEGRAEYIRRLTSFVAHHIERLAHDADASISIGKIDAAPVNYIIDAGCDIAGDIARAADRVPA